jgi:hypothetical protein
MFRVGKRLIMIPRSFVVFLYQIILLFNILIVNIIVIHFLGVSALSAFTPFRCSGSLNGKTSLCIAQCTDKVIRVRISSRANEKI